MGRAGRRARAVAATLIACSAARPTIAQDVTVSGQSAGGSMAVQHLVAFSKNVRGAGIAAGSLYGCGALPGGHLPRGKCYYGGTDVDASVEYIRQHFRQGLIDDPINLKDTPVLLFNGKSDWEVYTKCMVETKRQLEKFVDPHKLASDFSTNAAHVWSLDHGQCSCGACALTGSGECCNVNNCQYDFSGDMFTRFYGPMKPRKQVRKRLHWISQLDYLPPASSSWALPRLSKWAMAYVPTGCEHEPQKCRVHINYHGCIVNNWRRRLNWATSLDLNEYGEANDIIILYPQAKGDRITGAGCWNWGFPQDDSLFDTKFSVQLVTVTAIVADLPNALRRALELPFGHLPMDNVSSRKEQRLGLNATGSLEALV